LTDNQSRPKKREYKSYPSSEYRETTHLRLARDKTLPDLVVKVSVDLAALPAGGGDSGLSDPNKQALIACVKKF
jgi:hypothetical protein